MGDKSKIEWTDSTWNPIRARRKDTGKVGYHCERVSPACQHCYAATFNRRGLAVGTGLDYTVPNRENVEIYLDEKTLLQPLSWKRPRKIFVCSMTDLFGEFVPDELIDRVHAIMALCPQHTFMTLTKRAARMEQYLDAEFLTKRIFSAMMAATPDAGVWSWGGYREMFEHVWRGVTAEDQQRADERIPHLLRTPAEKRFVSVEPMLGRVNLNRIEVGPPGSGGICYLDVLNGRGCSIGGTWDYGKLDWVIVGGESGTAARSMDLSWVRDLRDQCKAAGVACFVKQMGAKPYISYLNPNVTSWDDELIDQIKLRDRKGGDMEEWPEDLRVREVPQ